MSELLINEKREQKIISTLRNSYGVGKEEMRDTRLEAANLIERYREAYLNMRRFAEDSGLDTKAYNK